jgi:hypothetical protein
MTQRENIFDHYAASRGSSQAKPLSRTRPCSFLFIYHLSIELLSNALYTPVEKRGTGGGIEKDRER